jgi:hypothetical protein
MWMRDDKYRPRRFEEIDGDGVSWINEPIQPDNVSTLVLTKQRSLHAVLCEALMNTQALLARLEGGVSAPPGAAREVVRLLYVAARHQVKALTACLELDGLE